MTKEKPEGLNRISGEAGFELGYKAGIEKALKSVSDGIDKVSGVSIPKKLRSAGYLNRAEVYKVLFILKAKLLTALSNAGK